jgi:hypothetical protein
VRKRTIEDCLGITKAFLYVFIRIFFSQRYIEKVLLKLHRCEISRDIFDVNNEYALSTLTLF